MHFSSHMYPDSPFLKPCIRPCDLATDPTFPFTPEYHRGEYTISARLSNSSVLNKSDSSLLFVTPCFRRDTPFHFSSVCGLLVDLLYFKNIAFIILESMNWDWEGVQNIKHYY